MCRPTPKCENNNVVCWFTGEEVISVILVSLDNFVDVVSFVGLSVVSLAIFVWHFFVGLANLAKLKKITKLAELISQPTNQIDQTDVSTMLRNFKFKCGIDGFVCRRYVYMGIGQIRRHITLGMLIWRETVNGILCCFGGNTDI